jgi:MFS family permease
MRHNLSSEHKEAIVLMSIGTFLEYFDLMLFVHMAVLLNDLFFPKADPFVGSIMSAFAFCLTYVFQPLGALLFGYIGDRIGRKHTVIITTMMMAVSCIIMANIGTYAEIGITATWVMIICRALQSMSAIGESTGAELYVLETVKRPYQYIAVGLIGVSEVVGMSFSLIIAKLVTSLGIDWRMVFWIGVVIAVIGLVARRKLREAPEYSDAKRRVKQAFKRTNQDDKVLEKNVIWNEKVPFPTTLYYFLIFCGWPFCFYFSYIYCGSILKNQFHYSNTDIISHNAIVGICNLIALFGFVMLTKKIHPLKILKVKAIIYLIFLLFVPFILNNSESGLSIFVVQLFGVALGNSTIPAKAIFLQHFPIFKRFTYAGVLKAVSHIAIYIITSFGLVYLVKFFGNYGILMLSIPITIAFLSGTLYFIKLEKKEGSYS